MIFGQYANMGSPALVLAQAAAGVVADGKVGPKTVDAINDMGRELFLNRYCIAMVARYHAIGMRDTSQRGWWPGWFARALRIAP